MRSFMALTYTSVWLCTLRPSVIEVVLTRTPIHTFTKPPLKAGCIFTAGLSTMEYSLEQLNYSRICYIAFNLVPDGLREIFKQEWDFRFKMTPSGEWKDTPQNGLDFSNNESQKSRTKNARYLATIQNGNTAEWDCSYLFFAILYSDSIGKTLSLVIEKDVDDLRQVRNHIAHIGEAILTDVELRIMLEECCKRSTL